MAVTVLVTGGAGFIGRWVVRRLLEDGHNVIAFDNLSSGSEENIEEFKANPNFNFITADIREKDDVSKAFAQGIDTVIHLAAQINVQESLDHPERSFENNIVGTYNILEECRKNSTKVVIVGTCMVYDLADTGIAITEEHPVKPLSPYAASKLAAEELAISYYHGFQLPVVVLRPFNTYGPFQKGNMEGGVVSIFVQRNLAGQDINIYGDGTQTRDLLYVEDCAKFIAMAAFNKKAVGETINAGNGQDISVNELAHLICKDGKRIKHVPHHHPQAEIKKLVCDCSKAKNILGWHPEVSLQEGIKKLEEWMKSTNG